ncbi:Neuronal acetylcholine receptor subunit alpha-3 [Cichlidogyrus casuarinus]|uniref:Neuronal acetylcholine receptor subunit alpha-3 n=1 Tax=Cichlidogyrus casuarinus TaxID=1844966 RepID=A0ABD2PR16_9PLAT
MIRESKRFQAGHSVFVTSFDLNEVFTADLDGRCSLNTGLCGPDEKRLRKHLFDPKRPDAHNKLERPVANDTKAVDVAIRFIFNQLMDLDEKNQVMTTIIWIAAVFLILCPFHCIIVLGRLSFPLESAGVWRHNLSKHK